MAHGRFRPPGQTRERHLHPAPGCEQWDVKQPDEWTRLIMPNLVMPIKRCLITSALPASALLVIGIVFSDSAGWHSAQAAATQPPSQQATEPKLSPEERMQRRFPQPARVGALIGRPVLDDDDNTLGYVERVVRTRDGKINLIVRYGGWFGWIGWGQRLVAVPIERVALIGPHVGAVEMTPAQFSAAPTWQPSPDVSEIKPDETIRVAITRR
jgi:PRC-barrel domain